MDFHQLIKKFPLERFFARVNKRGPVARRGLGPCWIWTASTNRAGYGVISVRGEKKGLLTMAHRYAYQALVGEILDGKIICHHCDTSSCVNPKHLYLGTYKTNAEDRENRGRTNNRRKISSKQVEEIRNQAAKGVKRKHLAQRYGVSVSHINNIVANRTRIAG